MKFVVDLPVARYAVTERDRADLLDVANGDTEGKSRATKITMVPASPGTGVIAGTTARAVLEYAGVRNVLTKIYGSTSAKNVVKAVLDGLNRLRDKETIESLRGIEIEDVKRW